MRIRRYRGRGRDIRVVRDPAKLLRNIFRREHEVDAARRYGAARHRVITRGTVLGECDSALAFDGFQPQRAVGCGAGKNHSDGAVLTVFCQ